MTFHSITPKPRGKRFIVVLLAAMLAAGGSLFGQSLTTGEISGTLTDPSGSALPNSTLNLSADETGEQKTATTNGAGEFRFSLLRPGLYTVSVNAPGFQSLQVKTAVALGQVSTLKLQASLAAQVQTVEVTSDIPLLQTDNANLATTYDQRQLENLPAPGNDMTAYAFTAPGVTVSTGGGYGDFSVFGLPGTSNLFTINGADNMDPYLNLNNSGASNLTLGSNEIQEAAVVMNGYTGQYGRQAGAQVNYITKSGTNAFHGNADWQYNERVMNANDWFNNATGTPQPFAVSNEWADSIGGPIVRNKAFFFFDNEGLRYVLPGGGPIYIPTTDFANFVLNNLATTNPSAVPFYTKAFGVYAGSSGAGRATPVGSDVAHLGCGTYIDPAGVFGVSKPCAETFRSTVNSLNTEWLLATRVDVNLSSNDHIYFRYNTDHGVQATGTDAINPAFNANSVQPSYGGQFGYTRTLGPNMVNQLNLAASYYSAIFGPPDLSAALGVFPTTFAFTDGQFTNLGGSDNNYPQGRKVRQWEIIDDFSLIRGPHTFKVGLNLRQNWVSTYAYGANTSGLFTFNSMTDFINGTLDNDSTYSQTFSRIGAVPLSLYSLGAYLQDEWKIRPNITLTLALRFDHNSNIHCDSGCFNELGVPFESISHDVNQPYNAVIKTGLTDAFPDVEPIVVAPRIGMAYTINRNTVLRGGFGIFSDLYQGLIADRFITNSPAVATFQTLSGTVAQNDPNSAFSAVANSNAAFQNGFSSGSTLAQLQAAVPGFTTPTLNTVANKLYNPKYYEWNIELQRALGPNLNLSVNYVGNHGYDEINQSNFLNAYAPAGFSGLPTTAPDPRFAEIRELSNPGYSNYDGLVTSLNFRMGRDLSGRFNYTWSHSLDTCSNNCLEPFNALTDVSVRSTLSPAGVNTLSYGNSDYDTRHSISALWSYEVPTRYLSNGFAKAALGGWTLAGTALYHSGYPYSIVNSGVRSAQLKNLTGLSSQVILADYFGGPSSCSTPNAACFDSSNFSTSTSQNDFGNLSRNSFRGPGYFDSDVNIHKVFEVHERYRLLVGAYLFNVFNHPNFDLPVNNLASGVFGYIQNTVSPPTSAYGSFQGSAVSGRVIQTQIKFTF